jgi:hypothetical protein
VLASGENGPSALTVSRRTKRRAAEGGQRFGLEFGTARDYFQGQDGRNFEHFGKGKGATYSSRPGKGSKSGVITLFLFHSAILVSATYSQGTSVDISDLYLDGSAQSITWTMAPRTASA